MGSGYNNCANCNNYRYVVRMEKTKFSPEGREPCKECNYKEWLKWSIRYMGYEPIKQLTIEELREQFERRYNMSPECYGRDMKTGKYLNPDLENQWFAYQECAKANGILKD